jgi:cell division protein FtsA
MPAKSNYAVGLDLGGARTRCAICVLDGGRIRFLGSGEVESEGWSKGRIADQKAVAASALAALREAERRAQVSVESAVVGVGGPTVRGANARGVIELGRPRDIEQRDVNQAVKRATYVQLMEDRMVLQLFPQDFVVDEHPGHRDPRGMVASRLEANVHLITTSTQEHNAVIGAVNQAHLSVEETVFEPIAACYAAVLPEDRRQGVALVDIGAQSTDLAIYHGDALQLASTLPLCADHFTRDLALGLHIGFEDSELVKRQFGCAVSATTAEYSLVELPALENREPREAPRRLLNRILEARAHELFGYVRREVARGGMERALFGGVVLTGGCTNLPGLCDVAEAVLNCQVRKGLPLGILGWPDEIDSAEWTTAAGLAMYSGRLKMQSEMERHAGGLLARMLR